VVLCVDADESALAIRRFLLDSKGYRVLSATSEQAGLRLAAAEVPIVAVISCDLGWTHGNELVKKINELDLGIRTILMSPTQVPGERAHNADAFLGKHFSAPIDLVDRVKGLSARRRGPKPGVREMVG
jgi:two-component system response regulator CpxR